MANSLKSNEYYEYAVVNTAPPAGGFWTNPVSMRRKGHDLHNIFFSVREENPDASSASVVVPTLQFRCSGDAGWTDYYNEGSNFAIGERKNIEGTAAGVQWRAGVKEGAYTSGGIVLGFDW